MPITLDPASGELFSTSQDVFTSADITASGDDLPVTWEWSIDPPTENITITEGDTTLNVAYSLADGLFPFTVGYLDANNVLQTVTRWADVPVNLQESPEVIEMLQTQINNKVWTIVATATNTSEETAQGTYTVKVEANYSLNRDILIVAVEEREA